MTGAPEGLLKGPLGADQHVRTPPHVSGDQDGLTDLPIGSGDVGVMGGEGPGCTLAVNAEALLSPFDRMALHLGDVVTHIVDKVQPEGAGSHVQNLLKGLTYPVGDDLPIGKGEVSGAGHGR